MNDAPQTNEAQVQKPDLKTLVEAFILVSDGPVSFETLAQAMEQDVVTIDFVVAELEGDYATRGIRLQKMRDRVQFVSAPEVSEYVQKYLGLDTAPRLSPAGLETLAIIAYRQPITRPQIEAIRGVNCDGVVHTLLARNLVEPVGELDTVGHPTLYGTTFDFLQYFGLTSLEQLPPLPDNMMPVLPVILGNDELDSESEADQTGAESKERDAQVIDATETVLQQSESTDGPDTAQDAVTNLTVSNATVVEDVDSTPHTNGTNENAATVDSNAAIMPEIETDENTI
jgi:segregation and condensation protein B